jgi:hypothetical protein
MSLTEEEQFIKERRLKALGKYKELDNLNSKINNTPITPSIPDNTPSDLQSVFSTDMDGYNPFVTKKTIHTKTPNATLPEKYSLETLANKTGPLYHGGKKSKKQGFSKSKGKSRRASRRVRRGRRSH